MNFSGFGDRETEGEDDKKEVPGVSEHFSNQQSLSDGSASYSTLTSDPRDPRFLNDLTPPSLAFKSPKDSLYFACNCLDATQRRHVSLKPDFSKTCVVSRGSDYKVCFQSQKTRNMTDFTSLKFLKNFKVLPKPKYSLSLIFDISGTGRMFSIQFKNREYFEYMKKLSSEIIKINQGRIKSRPIARRVKFRKITDYRIDPLSILQTNSKSLEFNSSDFERLFELSDISESSNSGRLSKFTFSQFFLIDASNWKPIHYLHWFQHLYYQPFFLSVSLNSNEEENKESISNKDFISLFDFLVAENLYIPLQTYICDFFEKRKNSTSSSSSSPSAGLRKNNKNSKNKSLFVKLLEDLKKLKVKSTSSSSESESESELDKIIQNEQLCNYMISKCEELYRNPTFDINRFFVLRKRVLQVSEQQKKDEKNGIKNSVRKTLAEIEEDLDTDHSYWWNIDDCRDHVLSLLLFKKSFNTFIRERSEAFFKFEELEISKVLTTEEIDSNLFLKIFKIQNPEKWNEKLSDLEYTDDLRYLLTDDEMWQKLLDEFNTKNNIKMELVSYPIFVHFKQNLIRKKLRKEFERIMSLGPNKIRHVEETIKLLNIEKSEILETLEATEERIKLYDDEILRILDEDDGGDFDKIDELEDIKGKLEKTTKPMKVRKKEIYEKIDLCEKELNELKSSENLNLLAEKTQLQKDLEKEILEMIPELKANGKHKFMSSKERKMYREIKLREFLGTESSKQTEMSEFTVKLVISIKPNYEAGWFNRTVVSIVDKIMSPSFYKWGVIHASVQIQNLGFHWLGDELVMCSELEHNKESDYCDIIALDCNCPLLFSKDSTIYERLNKLSWEIVNACVNGKYEFYSFKFGSSKAVLQSNTMNCQEFAYKLICTLNNTEFFSEVLKYLDELKIILQNQNSQKSHNIRFLRLPKNFKKIFAPLFRKVKVKANDEKSKSIRINEPWKIENGKVHFNKHSEIDRFFNDCFLVDEDFRIHYPGIFALLKGFDRAFWIQWKKNEDKDSEPFFEELGGEKKYLCPFNHVGII